MRLHFQTSAVIAVSSLLLTTPIAYAQNDAPPSPLTQQQIQQQLDPQMAEVIYVLKTIAGTPIVNLSPQDARQQFSAQDAAKIIARGAHLADAAMPVGKVQDGLTIEGSDGNQIPIRIYTPKGAGPFPVTLYFHGGGFVIATSDTYDASARALCDYANSLVISVEYRKAPEAQFPAARHDAISAYKWTIDNAAKYNGISSKIALAGESAGGNLATEVAIEARNQGMQRPTHELLIYPVTSSNLDQPSDIKYANAVPLNTPLLKYFFKFYLDDPSEANDPEVAPINADLHNLPPTTIIAAQIDPLQSDGKAYAAKLREAGNEVQYRLYRGTTHEFFGLGAVVEKAKDAEMFAASRLDKSFQ